MDPVGRFLEGDSLTIRQVQSWATQIIMQRWPRLAHLKEDIVQETLLSLYKTLQKDGFKLRNDTLKGLTRRVATARCHDCWGKLERERCTLEALERDHGQSVACHPVDNLDLENLHSLLRMAFVRLGLKQQRLIRIHCFEEQTYEQMAADFDRPVGTMKTRFRASINALTHCMATILEDVGLSWVEAQEVANRVA